MYSRNWIWNFPLYFHSSSIDFRCSCDQCNVELLATAREYRCCREVLQAVGKLTFEGIEAKCVTEHPDFAALTNATVLQNVGPLLRGKTGRRYKYPSTGSQNAKNEWVCPGVCRSVLKTYPIDQFAKDKIKQIRKLIGLAGFISRHLRSVDAQTVSIEQCFRRSKTG